MSALPIAEEDDLLTQELNGLVPLAAKADASEIEKQEQPPSLEDQLNTATPARPSRVDRPAAPRAAAADQVHSVKAGGRGYRVVVAGDYKAATPQGPTLREYELPFNLPELKNSKGDAALGIILNASHPEHSLLMRALKKKDPDFKTIHTHFIKSVTPLNGAPEPVSLQYMGLPALQAYAKSQDMGIDPDEYWDVEHLRADIIHLKTNNVTNLDSRTGEKLSDAIRDGKGIGVKVSPLDFVKKRHQERKDAKALLEMNPGLED